MMEKDILAYFKATAKTFLNTLGNLCCPIELLYLFCNGEHCPNYSDLVHRLGPL